MKGLVLSVMLSVPYSSSVRARATADHGLLRWGAPRIKRYLAEGFASGLPLCL